MEFIPEMHETKSSQILATTENPHAATRTQFKQNKQSFKNKH